MDFSCGANIKVRPKSPLVDGPPRGAASSQTGTWHSPKAGRFAIVRERLKATKHQEMTCETS